MLLCALRNWLGFDYDVVASECSVDFESELGDVAFMAFSASCSPVEAPDGTDALPTIPDSNNTSTSTLG
jgi:hypothetical protein